MPVLRPANPADVQRLPGLPTGLYFFCEACERVCDGQPIAWFRSRPVCSDKCFDVLAEADRIVAQDAGPLTWPERLAVAVAVVAALWAVTR